MKRIKRKMNKNEHHEHTSLHSRQKTMCIMIRQYSNQKLHKYNMHNHFSCCFFTYLTLGTGVYKANPKKKKKCWPWTQRSSLQNQGSILYVQGPNPHFQKAKIAQDKHGGSFFKPLQTLSRPHHPKSPFLGQNSKFLHQ